MINGFAKRMIIVYLLICFSLLGITSLTYADSAEVLPKGIYRVSEDANFFFPVDERYGPDGKVENVAVDYNTALGSGVFSGLSLVESAFGLPAGSATLGDSVVSLKYYTTTSNTSFQYGVTDKLTAGINIPYWWRKNKVNAVLDSSGATVGKSAAINSLAPIGFLDTVPLTTEDVQNLLGKGLDINGDGTIDIPGRGYKRIETWSGNGIGDTEAGVKYQYFKTEEWRLALTGGMKFPTGKIDDPDNLMDLSLGEGAYVLLLRLNNDYAGIKNLVLNGTIRYDYYLPDKVWKRVPDNVNSPITDIDHKERVDRKIGDDTELEVSGKYTLLQGLNFSLLYKYEFAMKDHVSGNMGFAYESLEKETNYTGHIGIAGLSYSTLPLYLEKKFPVPITASLSYRNRFAGSNNAWKSQYIDLGLEVLF